MSALVTKGKELNLTDTYRDRIYSIDDVNDIKDGLILLYIYNLPSLPMHGFKVGMTKCILGETFWHAIKERIGNQVDELCLSEEEYAEHGNEREALFWGICVNDQDDDFKDHTIHRKIKSKIPGLAEKDHEWFYGYKLSLGALKAIFYDYRESNEPPYEIYKPRDEQKRAIDAMKNYFDSNPDKNRFLLNCKMRFGKCYTVYKYAEETNQRKVLILTFVPAVENEWRNNLKHIETKYDYFTDADLRKPSFVLNNNPETPYVVFLSLQNYLGKDSESKETKEKIAKLQDIDFDLLVLDEYHFGAWNDRTQETIEDFDSTYEKNLEKEKNQLDFAKKFNIKVKETICLSGTPFKAIDRGEFTDENTFSYSYFDEQMNKYPNSEINDFETINDDYAQFPDMEIYGYNIANIFGGDAIKFMKQDKEIGRRDFFSLNRFFETEKDKDERRDCVFVYENQVKVFLDTLNGAKSERDYVFPYQYTNIENVRHALWLMPTVNACVAMARILEQNHYFNQFKIINISDPEIGAGRKALDFLNEQILAGEQEGKHGSITLTVNKLTLGVTVPQWSAALVLKDLSSPEQYFQSIFRIQNPLIEENKIVKKKCKVYDFNIDRASALLLKYAEESSGEQTTKLKVAELIVRYMPIYLNGDVNKKIAIDVFYDLAQHGDTSGKPLSQRATDTSRTAHMDDQTMSDMINDPECSEVIKKIFAHTKFNSPSNRTRPVEAVEYHKTDEYKKGLDVGYKDGEIKYREFLELDEAQGLFEECVELLYKETVPSDYNEEQHKWYHDGLLDGFVKGVNAPIKKMQCGASDGVKFVDEIRNQLGKNIQYTDETKVRIKNIINTHLNDINNIPEQYRGQLYRKWYCDSFRNAAIRELKPPKPGNSELSVEDVDNVLKHILAKVFQFLYISVYRETTFEEIFNNADPQVFLSAVGIKKEDFQILNKYHVFQEKILDNYIHEFFVNETLGKNMTEAEKESDLYRNSFNWFGYGINN